MGGERRHRLRLLAARPHQEHRVERDRGQAVRARLGEADRPRVALDEVEAAGDRRAGGRGCGAGPREHRRIEVHAGDVVPRRRERDGEAPAADGELQDRAAGPRGEREEQVEVARVLGQVEVVEAGERVGRGLAAHAVPGPEKRTGRPPSCCLAASAEITSSATRLAAIAVTSAWSYGGETSTMSIPAISTADAIRRTARSTSRGQQAAGLGGARCRGRCPGR